jgi:hypothetical protein
MVIQVDGTSISNTSGLDFRVSSPMQHSFNCVGLTTISAGTHTVTLLGYNDPSVSGGQFYVGSTSNLAAIRKSC